MVKILIMYGLVQGVREAQPPGMQGVWGAQPPSNAGGLIGFASAADPGKFSGQFPSNFEVFGLFYAYQ